MALPVWVRSTKWKPASPGGGSGGFPVECPDTGELGHGKPTRVAQEVLAARIAREIGVTVPETVLGTCEDQMIAVSKLFGAKSLDVPTLGRVSPADYGSDSFAAALRAGSALLPFHAWLGTEDLKDEHVLVCPGPSEGTFEVASIDFAIGAFVFPNPVAVPPGPPCLVNNRDAAAMLRTIDRMEGIADERIRGLVESLPEELLSTSEKRRVSEGLIHRRGEVRQAFTSAGWLQ
jgi:hypothetical protein